MKAKRTVKRKQKPHTITLSDLPGVKRRESKGVCVRSVTKAMAFFRAGKIVTAAGSWGALTVWRDDDGIYRCEFQRFLITRGKLLTARMQHVHDWLRKWFPRLETCD